MKVEELMLGDLVSVEGEVLRVGGLSNYDIYVDLFRDNENEVYSQIWADELDAIKPIPLTPEILEKNGFIYLDENVWGKTGTEINIYLDYGQYATITHKGFLCIGGRGEIHFVHELQHALRLCGIEKTIEL